MDERPLLEDWAQLISFRPDLVLRPTSIDELKAMLERVHRGELGDAFLPLIAPMFMNDHLAERLPQP